MKKKETNKEREARRAKDREYRKKLYAESAERRAARTARTVKWQQKNLPHVRATAKARYDANVERYRAYGRDWYYKNREKAIETSKRCALLKRYGLTVEQRDALGTACHICGAVELVTKKGRRYKLHVDHCHETKKVRGLLCHHCNTGLGQFKHDVALMQKAIRYLEQTYG